jgi:hypothetical protein
LVSDCEDQSVHWLRALGLAVTAAGVGVAGYLAGIATAYPGRAFSVTAVIVGITLASIGRRWERDSRHARRRGRHPRQTRRPRGGAGRPGTTWVGVTDPTDAELDAVTDGYGLHHPGIEDVLGDGRPKVEEFADHTFVPLKAATLRRGDAAFRRENWL